MIDSPGYSGTGAVGSDETHALFGQTMGYVAATAGLFALGAYLGGGLPYGWSIVGYIAGGERGAAVRGRPAAVYAKSRLSARMVGPAGP